MLVANVTVPVYSCPDCITSTTFMCERVDQPLTFFVGIDGKPRDPIDLTVFE